MSTLLELTKRLFVVYNAHKCCLSFKVKDLANILTFSFVINSSTLGYLDSLTNIKLFKADSL